MLNWQPQTGDMASYHRRKEIQHVWKAPSSMAQLCESNSIPLIRFRHAAFCGFPTRPVLASLYLHQRKHGKIQGNPICAADPSPPGVVLSCAPCFSRTSSLRLDFEHNARAFTTASGRIKQLRQRASRACRPTRKNIHYTTNKRNGSLLLGLEHSHIPLSFVTSTEMLIAMQRLGRAS
jgi:hypothetical protein